MAAPSPPHQLLRSSYGVSGQLGGEAVVPLLYLAAVGTAGATYDRGPEHTWVRKPIVERLVELGWSTAQLQWEPEWRVPKAPHEASKREGGKSFEGWPVDLVVFDSEVHVDQWEHVTAIFEFKAPDEEAGRSQLEIYLAREPRAKFGYWTNGTQSVAVFKLPDGNFDAKYGHPLPTPDDNLSRASSKSLTYADLRTPTARELRAIFGRLLEITVVEDSRSTRPDDQLNQLCNLILLKLASDNRGSEDETKPVRFQLADNEIETGRRVREQFDDYRRLRRDVFTEAHDEKLQLDDRTIHQAVYELSSWRILDMQADAVSYAFQVFRRANLKAGEGQYFTPPKIIESAIALMEITSEDKIIDPACGTGGFLIEAFRSYVDRVASNPKALANSRTWAHNQVFGVDRDAINVKLARAIMVILGDGSANIHVGDSLRETRWKHDYPHLAQPMQNESYTVVITNPPFGRDLKVSAQDARRNNYTIAHRVKKSGVDFFELEVGLIFLERAYRLLMPGGRLGIVLPETYFFSPSYEWLSDWLEPRLRLRGMLNIPMEAFQGFCRAKTNFYVFERLASNGS